MEIIEQSVEILDRSNQLKVIELAGRTCWKSESKIHDYSCQQFVKNIIKVKHLSVIEHGVACFKVRDTSMQDYLDKAKFITIRDNHATGNYRAWLELIQSKHCFLNGVLRAALHKIEPVIFDATAAFINTEKYLQNIQDQDHISARFITDRSVTHELVRHRNDIAFSQESQRYVNYQNGVQYIKQINMSTNMLRSYFAQNEAHYKQLIEEGHKPQHARCVLMNAVKTEIVVTANIKEWKHIIALRTSKAAHPQIRALINDFKEKTNRLQPCFLS